MKVREILPKRRSKTTKNPTTDWSKHKPDLAEDFKNHCAYCGSYDGFRHTYYEVDHFIPKDFLKKTGSKIGLCDYSNLVYSCKFCNRNKEDLWPTKNERRSHFRGKGFIDPCKKAYDDHLERTPNGGIMWNTPLGKWMATVAFKFDERDSSIKLIWELERRLKLVLAFEEELKMKDKNSKIYKKIKETQLELSHEYVLLHSELMEYYNSI